jgi:hypothetical protein
MYSALTTAPSRPTLQSADRRAQAASSRRVHRERDFGVGYGNSSGYASERRYSPNGPQPRFRFG